MIRVLRNCHLNSRPLSVSNVALVTRDVLSGCCFRCGGGGGGVGGGGGNGGGGGGGNGGGVLLFVFFILTSHAVALQYLAELGVVHRVRLYLSFCSPMHPWCTKACFPLVSSQFVPLLILFGPGHQNRQRHYQF